MTGSVVFDPLLPWVIIAILASLAAAGIGLALWRGLQGWALRALAALVVLMALAQPSYQIEDRAPLTNIVLIVEDKSASQTLGERFNDTTNAAVALAAQLNARPNTEIRRIEVGDGEGDTGTLLMSAVADALAEEPRGRIAGVFLLSDGRLHDVERTPDLPAPLHLLLTGNETDWDRRLIVKNAPAFSILGEPVTLTLLFEFDGSSPPT